MFNSRTVVFNLILINVIVNVVASFILPGMYTWFSLFYPGSPLFQPVQLVSHMFMHESLRIQYGFMHVLFNMFALYMFGTVLEQVWGAKRFLFFYFFTGLGSAALHIAVQGWIVHNFTGSFNPPLNMVNEFYQIRELYGTPTVGASGAIFGVLVAFGMLFPNTDLFLFFIPVPIKAKYAVVGYVVYEIYSGIVMNPGDNVAHFAHLGGALFGFILVRIWNRDRHTLY